MNDATSPQGALGVAVRNARVAANISSEEMAERMGMSRSAIGRLESGRDAMTEETYRSMIRHLSDLIGRGTR